MAAIQSSAVDAVRALSQQQDEDDSLSPPLSPSLSPSPSPSPAATRRERPPDQHALRERYDDIIAHCASDTVAEDEARSLLSASPAIASSSDRHTRTYLSRDEEDGLKAALSAIDDREVTYPRSLI